VKGSSADGRKLKTGWGWGNSKGAAITRTVGALAGAGLSIAGTAVSANAAKMSEDS